MSSPLARRGRLAVAAVFAMLLLGACTGRPPTPTGYGDTTERNFMRGCVDSAKDDGIRRPQDYCQCSYDGIVESIEFDRFKEINSELSDNPGPLPDEMLKIRDACEDQISGSS